MALTPDDVARLARLARIDLTPQELDRLAPQLDLIVESVARVSEIATADVPATSHALPLTNVMREDRVQPSWPRAEVVAMAPEVGGDRFRVPRILGEQA